MGMERVSIFIDSGNFYHLVLKKLNLQEVGFNFEKFANFLADGRQIIKEGKRFYVGTVRERQDGHENKKAMENQTKLFSNLEKSGNWAIKTSKLRTRTEKIKIDNRVTNYEEILKRGISEIEYKKSREKGIDVKLAVDLLVGVIDNKYDTAIVVSSDTDLVPAIDWVRKRSRKRVEYVGFSIPYADPQNGIDESTKPTKTMIYNSDIQRVLIESDIKPFIKLKAVIFDLNGVFIQSPKLSDRFCNEFGVPSEEFLLVLKEIMAKVRMPKAGDAFSYWKPHLDKWGVNLSKEGFFNFWFGTEKEVPEMTVLAEELKRKGLKVFILSNNFVERATYYGKNFPFLKEVADKIYYSWQTGFIKPGPKAYKKILTENDLKPEECAYFDDVKENIEIATGLGIKSFIFEGADKTRAILEE